MLDEERVDDRDRDRSQQRRRHELAPVEHVAAHQFGDRADRHGAHVGLGEEDQRIQELVLRQREGEDAGGDEARDAQRQEDAEHGLQPRGAIDARGVLQFVRHGLEIAHQQPGAERHQQCRIGQDHRGQRVAEPQTVDDVGQRNEQQRLRHQIGRRHRERHQRRAGEAHARQRIGEHHAEHQRDRRGDHRDQHRVVGPGEEAGLGQQVDEVLERRMIDDQRHDLAAVQLAVRLQRGDRHPVEREQREDQEEAKRQPQLQRPVAAPALSFRRSCAFSTRACTTPCRRSAAPAAAAWTARSRRRARTARHPSPRRTHRWRTGAWRWPVRRASAHRRAGSRRR